MPFVESRGRRIYYERQGVGPAVVFMHGAGSNAATWWQQLPAFMPRHTCITLDIRCFGRSVAPLQEFALPTLADDVLAVLDREAVPRATLVGQSLGGMIGLKLSLVHPGRVAAFVACDTSLAIDHPMLLDIISKRQITHRAVTIEQRSLGRWFLAHHPDKAALYAQINHFNPSAHSIPGAEWGAALGALMKPEALIPMHALQDLAAPTLLLVGSEDPIVPVGVMREVSGLVDGSEVVVVDDAGHSAYFEKPAEFNRAVLDFIARRAQY
jgi:3-oxoadipate enol-lactonase